jgi:hypothetical protein
MRRRVLVPFVALAVLAAVPTYSGEERLALLGSASAITATPVLLDTSDPTRVRVGSLTFLGGLALTNRDPAFGGFSAMAVAGDRFILLSDGGNIVRFRMRDWRIDRVAFANLPDGPEAGWLKMDRDSESLAHDPVTGRLWVGFEQYNQIWRYAAGFARAERRVAPPAMAAWNENNGPESLVRLRSGAFVVLAERSPEYGDPIRPGIRFAGDPISHPRTGFRFGYRPPAGFSPTDMAELPDGRLLILNRRARVRDQFTSKLVLVAADAIRPGAVVKGREIATLAPPLLHDNFEAMAVTREGADTILWIASDDNQWALQRSLLLKFRLETSPGRGPARGD